MISTAAKCTAVYKQAGDIVEPGDIICTLDLGSALSTYGIALLSEQAGWQATAFVWFAIAAAGCVICAVCAKIWK